MDERKRFSVLIGILIAVSLTSGVVTINQLYRAAFRVQQARLVEIVRSRARLIEAVARFDAVQSEDYPGGATAATISQIIDAHEKFQGFGLTGEFTLARRVDDNIEFLLSHRHQDLGNPEPVPFESDIAEPMRMALAGNSGVMVGRDYRGVNVLAAYEPVAVLALGIVAKIDISEVRAPFIKAGLVALLFAGIVLGGGILLAVRIGTPVLVSLTEKSATIEEYVKELTTSEQKMALHLESSPLAFIEWDTEFKVTAWNKAATSIFGYSEREAMGRHANDLVLPADMVPQVDEIWRALLAQTGGSHSLNDNITKDGMRITCEWFNTQLLDENKEVIGVASLAQDISERKRVDDNLRVSEETLQAIINNSSAVIFLKDLEGRFLLINDMFANLFHISKEDIIGKTDHDIFPKNAADAFRKADLEALESGNTIEAEEIVPQDGETHYYISLKFPLKDADGHPFAVCGIATDITERKQAEEVLQNAHDELEQRVEDRTNELMQANEALKIDITERKVVEERIKLETTYVKVMQEIAVTANESSTAEEALRVCLDKVCGLTGWPVGHVYLLDRDNNDLLVPSSIWHIDQGANFSTFRKVTAKTSFTRGEGLPGRVLASGAPEWIKDVTKVTNFPRAKAAEDIGVKAGVAFPVLVGDQVSAVLEFFAREALEPVEHLLDVIQHLGAQVGRIIERKQAEKALIESEALLENAQELARIGHWKLIPATGEITGSDELFRIFGLSREDVTLDSFVEVVHPDDREMDVAAIQRGAEHGENWDIEHRLICPDGKEKWVHAIGEAITDGAGAVIELVGTVQDITTRKLAEEKTGLESTYVKLLQEIAVTANESSDVEDALQMCVDKMCALTGWPVGHVYLLDHDDRDLLVSSSIWHLDEADSFRIFKEVTANTTFTRGEGMPGRVLATGAPEWIADVTKAPNFLRAKMAEDIGVKAGLAFPVLVGDKVSAVLEFFCTEAIEPVDRLLDVMKHIGAQMGRVIERQAAAEELQSREEQYRRLVENSPEMVYRYSMQRGGIYYSPGVEAVFGYPVEKMLAEPRTWHQAIHPDDVETADQAVSDFIKGQGFDIEYRVRDSEGNWHWLWDRSIGRLEIDGDIILEGIAMDITERRRMEEEVLKAQKLESIGTLAGGLAHDFNNYLSSIMLGVNSAGLRSQDEKVKDILHSVEDSVTRAKGVTHQLLTFARGGEPIKTAAHLESLLRESMDFSLHGSPIRVEFDLPDKLPVVHIDTAQISQVISNLALNAIKSMPDGGQISIKANPYTHRHTKTEQVHDPGDYVQVSISDKGMGIPRDIIGHIFDPYFTTHEDGTGLGLTSCYSILDHHGGWITAESEMGKGSTFTFYLPVTHNLVEPDKTKIVKEGHGRIMVMDDEDAIRNNLTAVLSGLGYDIVACPDGDSAIDAYRDALESGEEFDAVILDLTITGGTGGKDVIARLMEIDPNVNAIVSSGYATDPVMANYQEYGFKAALPKPYTLTDLSQLVAEVLG